MRRLSDATLGSQDAPTTPQVAPSVFSTYITWHPYCPLKHYFCQDWVPVPKQGARQPPAES